MKPPIFFPVLIAACLLLILLGHTTHECILDDCRYYGTTVNSYKQMIDAFEPGEQITDPDTLQFWKLHFENPELTYEQIELMLTNQIQLYQ